MIMPNSIRYIFASILLVSWSAPSSASEATVLRLWTIPNTSSSSPDAKAAARVIELFQQEHPDVVLRKASGINIPQIGGSAATLMAIAGGVAPDVLECSEEDIPNFVEQNFLLPLDEYLKDIPEEALLERAPRQVWDETRWVGPDGKKHIYVLPGGYSVSALKIRRDLAAKAGYSQEKLPKTWDEFYIMVQAMTHPDEGRYGVGLPKGNALVTVFHTLLVGAGGCAMDIGKDGRLHAIYDSEEGVLALDFLWKLARGPWEQNGKHYEGVAYTDTALWDPHKRGKFVIAFSCMGDRGIMQSADADRFLLAPLPVAPNGKSIPAISTSFVGLFAGQKNERVRKAAFDYLWLQESRAGRKLRIETLVQENAGLNANPLHLAQFGFVRELEAFPKGYIEFYRESLKSGYALQTGPGSSEIVRSLNNPVQRILVEKLGGLTDEARRARIHEILRESAAKTNNRLQGVVASSELRVRKGAAFLVAILIFAGFALLFRSVHRAYAPAAGRSAAQASAEPSSKNPFSGLKIALILMPALTLVTLWEYYPLIRGTMIAFQDYRFLGGTHFVGLENFVQVIFSPFFWAAMARTVLYVVLSIGLGFFAPIFLAIMLHEIPRGKVFYRVLYYLPSLTSGIVVMFLWKTFYEAGPHGYFNYLLSFLKIAPQKWLDEPNLAMLCCVLPIVWAGLGPGCLIYLAALKSVPEELFEAASMDGCGFFGKVRHVALPYMKPLVIINFIGVFIGTFQSSGYILVLTGGGPDGVTTVASLEIFYEAYARLRFGTATAMSWILAFSLIGFTLFQIKYLSKIEFRSASAR